MNVYPLIAPGNGNNRREWRIDLRQTGMEHAKVTIWELRARHFPGLPVAGARSNIWACGQTVDSV